ncbi:site-specific integrase [Azospirillum argentinense]
MTGSSDSATSRKVGGHAFLPEYAETRDGWRFRPQDPLWTINTIRVRRHLYFDGIPGITELVRDAMKGVVLWYLTNQAPSTGFAVYENLLQFARWHAETGSGDIERVNAAMLMSYYANLKAQERPWLMQDIRWPLLKWAGLRYPGLSDDVATYLIEVCIPTAPKGVAVATWDPVKGQFTDVELEALQASLNDRYAAGATDLQGFLVTWVFMLLGARPAQLALMKVCDVIVPSGKDDGYVLRVPRAKQPGQVDRDELKDRPIIPEVGALLVKHADNVRQAYVGVLPEPTKAPLFPDPTRTEAPKGFEFHPTTDRLRDWLRAAFGTTPPCSERTGEPMAISPIRFRRTKGTLAAREGYGKLVIAEILDHTDTQNVEVYTAATPEALERVDKALAFWLAPMARAFRGEIIDRTGPEAAEAPRQVLAPKFDPTFRPIGSCVKCGSCGLPVPIACYTCISFRPFKDAPHERVQEYVIAERNRLAADVRIASILDRTLLAVTQVIADCAVDGSLNE